MMSSGNIPNQQRLITEEDYQNDRDQPKQILNKVPPIPAQNLGNLRQE